MRRKRWLAAVLAAAAVAMGCGAGAGEAGSAGEKTYKIGVLQLVQHPALDKANEGFEAALKESGLSYSLDQQNASGEQSACQTIAEKFVNEGSDLIFAIATPAAQAAAAATETLPIVVSAVTDPAASGLAETNEHPGGNVTGSSDLTPVKEQMELLRTLLPEAKTVGILYCTAEANSALQVELAKKACAELGLRAEEYSVSSSNEIQTVTESMIGRADVIYVPTDNTIAAGMATVAAVATDNGLAIISGEEGQLEGGGLATYGVDYYELGYMAGKQAIEILRDGKKPGDLPIAYLSAEQCKLSVNEEQAAALGVDLSVLSR